MYKTTSMNDFNEHEPDEWEELETIQDFDGFVEVADDDVFHERYASSSSSGFLDRNMVIPRNYRMVSGVGMKEAGAVFSSPSTSVSILVSSLVSEYCSVIEKDRGRSEILYQSICKQLENMQLIDKTWSMNEFGSLRSSYKHSLAQLVTVAQGQDLRDPEHPQSLIFPVAGSTKSWSRYHGEFEELEFIAGGGFGKVYRARQKLDGIVYAVKKIVIKATTIPEIFLHMSEVQTFASFNHANIVPYKTAWLEPLLDGPGGDDDLDLEEDGEDDEDELSSMLTDEGQKSDLLKSTRKIQSRQESSSQSIVFERSDNGESVGGGGDLWSLTNDVSSAMTSMDMETTESDGGEGISRAVVHYNNSNRKRQEVDYKNRQVAELPHLKLQYATLYIQMTECHMTLRSWLDGRNQEDNFSEFYRRFLSSDKGDLEGANNKTEWTHLDVAEEIFGQLISGLGYIHSKKVIHHDIKPSNVFVSVDSGSKSNILVQLGDFGLACPEQRKHANKVVGTPLYAAPEQLKGHCEKKSDIFSLGVILIELLVPFATDMERNKTIGEVKKNAFPESIPETYWDLIRRLLATNAEKRPTAVELDGIFAQIRSARDPVVEDLQRKLTTKDEAIAVLTQEAEQLKQSYESASDALAKKEAEIARLHQELAQKEAKSVKSQKYISMKHKENRQLKKKLTQQTSSDAGESK